MPFGAAPRCTPKSGQTRRGVPTLVILGSNRATPYGPILGRNPSGQCPFSCSTALQHAHVARLHDAHCALSCKKMAAGAASGQTATRPMCNRSSSLGTTWPKPTSPFSLERRNDPASDHSTCCGNCSASIGNDTAGPAHSRACLDEPIQFATSPRSRNDAAPNADIFQTSTRR